MRTYHFQPNIYHLQTTRNRRPVASVCTAVIRVLHLLLIINLLASTVGVGVFEHLCEVNGRSASLVAAAKSCCASRTNGASHAGAASFTHGPSGDAAMTKAPYCQDHASWLKADLDGLSPTATVTSGPSAVLAWPVLAKAALPIAPAIEGLGLKVVRAMQYEPPRRIVDVRLRVRSFQI